MSKLTTKSLSKKDQELIDAATKAIKARYRNDWQEVGSALRTRDGRVVTGVNLDAYVGRGAICAEAVAIGRALTEKGDQGIETIVLAGVATGMAVGVAAFALADRFYNIIVPSDTATDGNKELHEVIFKAMLPAIALVTTTDDVIAHL